VLPRLPDTGWMRDSESREANRFADAYVRPEYAFAQTRGWNQGDISFQLNLPCNWAVGDLAHPGLPNGGLPDFWLCYFYSGFQPETCADADPDQEVGGPSGQYGGYGCTDPTRPYSVIHLEAIRDFAQRWHGGSPDQERKTVVHEAGHQFGSDGLHRDGGIMNTGWVEGSDRYFSDITVDYIRDSEKPHVPTH